jgi:hypothetical protein
MESVPGQSTISRTTRVMDVATHEVVLYWVLQVADKHSSNFAMFASRNRVILQNEKTVLTAFSAVLRRLPKRKRKSCGTLS